MMIIPDDFHVTLLLASNALLVAAGTLAIVRFRHQCRRLENFWSSPTAATLADSEESPGERERVRLLSNLRLEKQLAGLGAEVAALTRSRGESTVGVSALPLDNAVRMARNGASVDDLTRSCGLNIGEAQLIRKMHCKDGSEQRLSP